MRKPLSNSNFIYRVAINHYFVPTALLNIAPTFPICVLAQAHIYFGKALHASDTHQIVYLLASLNTLVYNVSKISLIFIYAKKKEKMKKMSNQNIASAAR